MKITDEDFAALRAAVAPHMKGDTQRERWDALWASPTAENGKIEILDKLYTYLHDDHIDTALRAIQREVTSKLKTAAPQDGQRSYCRLCGVEMEGMDYAWYALSASSPQRDVGKHHHVPARVTEGRPGEFGPDGNLVPGTPGGGGGQYDAPAGTIYDAGGNAIPITSAKKAYDKPGNDQNGQGESSTEPVEVTDEDAKKTMFPWEDTGQAEEVKHSRKLTWIDMKRKANFDGGALARLVGQALPYLKVSWQNLGGNVQGLVIENPDGFSEDLFVSTVSGSVGIGNDNGEYFEEFPGLDFVEADMRDIVDAVVTVAERKFATRVRREVTNIWAQGAIKEISYPSWACQLCGHEGDGEYDDVSGLNRWDEVMCEDAEKCMARQEAQGLKPMRLSVVLDPEKADDEDGELEDEGRVEVDVRTAIFDQDFTDADFVTGAVLAQLEDIDTYYDRDGEVVGAVLAQVEDIGQPQAEQILRGLLPSLSGKEKAAIELAIEHVQHWGSRRFADAANNPPDPDDVEVGDEDDRPLDPTDDIGEVGDDAEDAADISTGTPSEGGPDQPAIQTPEKGELPPQAARRKQAGDLDPSVAHYLLMELKPDFDSEDIRRLVSDFRKSDSTDMYEFAVRWVEDQEYNQASDEMYRTMKRKQAAQEAFCEKCGEVIGNESGQWRDTFDSVSCPTGGEHYPDDEEGTWTASKQAADMPGESNWISEDAWPHGGGTNRPEVENPVDMFDAEWVQRPEESESLVALAKKVEDLQPGDSVDLEGDPYADVPDPMFPEGIYAYEKAVVDEVTDEGNAIAVTFIHQGGDVVIGFPRGHEVKTSVKKKATTRHTLADPNVWKKLEALPALYATDGMKGDRPAVRLFNPYGNGSWIIWEYDPSTKEGFGWADLGYGELGYIPVSELASIPFMGKPGLGIERDTSVDTMLEGFQASGTTPPNTVMSKRAYNDADIEMMELAEAGDRLNRPKGGRPYNDATDKKLLRDLALNAVNSYGSATADLVEMMEENGIAMDMAADGNAIFDALQWANKEWDSGRYYSREDTDGDLFL